MVVLAGSWFDDASSSHESATSVAGLLYLRWGAMPLVVVFGLGSATDSFDGAGAGVVLVSIVALGSVEAMTSDLIDLSDVVRETAGLLFASLAGAAVLVSTDLFA